VIRFFSLSAILLCTTAAAAGGLRGSDLGLPDRRVDFNVRRARAEWLLGALANLAKRDVLVDACAADKLIDLKIANAPLPLVFDALATQAGFEYDLEGKAIRVHCNGSNASPASPAAPPRNAGRRMELRDALTRAYPRATFEEIDRAMERLDSQLQHD
jgi:hypothetical protein